MVFQKPNTLFFLLPFVPFLVFQKPKCDSVFTYFSFWSILQYSDYGFEPHSCFSIKMEYLGIDL